jgi:hypothetical protein
MSNSETSNAVAPTLAKALSMARACLVSGGITRQSFKLAVCCSRRDCSTSREKSGFPAPSFRLPVVSRSPAMGAGSVPFFKSPVNDNTRIAGRQWSIKSCDAIGGAPSSAGCRWRRKRVPFWRRSGPLPCRPFGMSLSLLSRRCLFRTARSRQGRAVVGRGEANP